MNTPTQTRLPAQRWSRHINLDFEITGKEAVMLAHCLQALGDDPGEIGEGPEWLRCALEHGISDEVRIRAASRLLAAACNPYRDGPIAIHIRLDARAGFEGHVSYDYRDPFDRTPTDHGEYDRRRSRQV